MLSNVARFMLGCLMTCGWVSGAQGWDARGHELIGAIAYAQLTPAVQQQVDALIHAPDAVYPVQDFIAAGTFADELKQQGVSVYHHWHYISQPYSIDGRRGQPAAAHNIVWAIEQCQAMVGNPQLPAFVRGFFLRMLIHLVGDIHQPLHTINVFSRAYPTGDLGGNRRMIKHPVAENLHQLWDRAGGLYAQQRLKRRDQLIAFANQLQIDYPRQPTPHVLTPARWAQQSYSVAIQHGYASGGMRSAPDLAYTQHVQYIAGQQLVLAGDRLADLLNDLFDT